MPRLRAPSTATGLVQAPAPDLQPAATDGVERLRAAVKERQQAQRAARPSFRDRLVAWLEEEL